MRSAAATLVAVFLTGCGFGLGVTAPGPPAPFPECNTESFAFVGKASLASLDLENFGGGPEAGRIGTVWITAGPVSMDQGGPPMPMGAQPMPPSRMICVEWPDGSGMSGPIEDTWQLPAAMAGAPSLAAANLPLGLVVLVIGAVLIVGASVLAFRGERASAP